jgi:hypothetical protein
MMELLWNLKLDSSFKLAWHNPFPSVSQLGQAEARWIRMLEFGRMLASSCTPR